MTDYQSATSKFDSNKRPMGTNKYPTNISLECDDWRHELFLKPRQEGRMNENRDVTSFLVSRLNQALMW